MRAILQDSPGEPETLYLGEAAAPSCGPGEVLITVRATAVNRADILQRCGLYQPPAGASTILGLEAMGEVAELGSDAAPWLRPGQRVMALLTGGGYAEQVVVPSGQVMPVPEGLTDEEAAAIPEVFLTAYLNLFCLCGLRLPESTPEHGLKSEPLLGTVLPRPQSVLIHGGASGIGTAALQLCRAAGVTAYCTVGADERVQSCRDLGAAAVWNYRSTDFVAAALAATEQRGIDIILDCIGASYLERNLRTLAPDGRLVCIGLLGVSGISQDMRTLLASDKPEAQEAVDLFCYRIVRELGSLAAAAGGLDALVFTGGIGEHAAEVRRRVCLQSEWLGIHLNTEANARHDLHIGAGNSSVDVLVIPTNEEWMMAHHAQTLLAL